MSFNLNKWLKDTIVIEETVVKPYQENRPRVFCKDGFSISIQASEYHYCTPRYSQVPPKSEGLWLIMNGDRIFSGDSRGTFFSNIFIPYKTVELGYPSAEDDLIKFYAEGDNYTTTVYAGVPVMVVEELIEKHGGFDYAKDVR